MYRVNRRAIGGFDERNAGGKEQTAMELRHFQAVISTTKFHPTTSSRVKTPRDLPSCFPREFVSDSQWKSSPFKQREEYRQHAQRLAYIDQHIQDYHAKANARQISTTPNTNFPAMHPETKLLSQSALSDYRNRLLIFTNETRQAILDTSLPEGWESALDEKGRPFYIDHNTQTTTWIPPS
ncbi:hypothetical protein THRCLA_07612 [Thraustotheca clavata]|uniref:WW domain-containing protein n=1 Tax=Thraustotheca clavata TaxID=74557 RepID=A0A1V9ZCM5_9STRA|nr:hypothetical protein THRCLA_07612 [Thraustotheca clavata]